MNAGTSYDYTIYFVNVPANKLELWFWMESDRLLNPVFREFYSEREVVHEERRLRTDSTPTGKFEEQFDSLFWQSSPYGWPVVGWPSDLEGITREEALSFFGLYYAPNNLTAALVGDFDPVEAKALAERYFGRLTRSERPAPQPRTREVPQLGEKRMTAYAETNPQVSIRYHSVPDGHVDEPPLVVLGQLLNGRTGRLYRSLVEEQEVATGASGGQNGMKFEGMFSLGGTAKDGRTPEEVEQALYVEIERLKTELVAPRELQKVKNQNAAANFRGLRSNYGLMTGLLVREAWRGWETINTDQALYDAVTAEDIRRVANTYFEPENRAVAVYYREESSEPPDPRLAGLDDQEREQVMQVIGMVGEATPEQLGQLASQIEQMGGQAPEENQDMIAALREIVQERLAAGGAGR
jgi:predicted Zn-dependent peptidase